MCSLVDQLLRFVSAESIRLHPSEVKGPSVDCREVRMIGRQINIVDRAEPNHDCLQVAHDFFLVIRHHTSLAN